MFLELLVVLNSRTSSSLIVLVLLTLVSSPIGGYYHGLKLHGEGEKAKKERRKEKKREKKEKHISRKDGEVEDKKHKHKRRHKDERSQEDQKGGGHHKRRKNEKEQVEKSSLTEEHGQPAASQNLCDSTDSTLNSSQRQKHSSPIDGSHNPGSIIRIRLPLQRHKEAEVLPPSIEQLCSASRSTNAPAQEKCGVATNIGKKEHPCSTSIITGPEIITELGKEKPCCISPVDLQFRNLIENWDPPQLPFGLNGFDDQNWLFETKQSRNCGTEGSKAVTNCLSITNLTPWPVSSYLPKADIYALPFTVPF